MTKKIVIDIGHGGKDPGAHGGGMLEKKVNWNVAMKLRDLLLMEGYIVVTTRSGDYFIDLSPRTDIINREKPDLFVSIHHNAGGGDGYDIIYQTDPKYTDKSRRLGLAISEEFLLLNNKHKVFTKPATHNPKEDWYTVLAKSNVPGVITEFAFLDSKDVEEVDTLMEQWQEAEAIFKGIKKFFRV
jgi:N-acetylmuramoyl-L-alanine amidase